VVYLPPDHVHGIRNIGAETLSLMWVFPTDSWGEVEYLFQ
jgi:oxalate decarboxylase/phosphoglucose isomerase-like protein (cupin superfamily)